MKVEDKRRIRFRVYLVALFFFVGLGIILVRAYQLQVIKRDEYAALARAGYEGTIKILPKRGTIYDRQGRELAISVEVESIYAHPNLVEKKFDAAKQLSRALGLNQKEILNKLQSNHSFVWVKRKTSPGEVKRVRALGLEGVGFTTEARRYYPNQEIGAHLIGFAGTDNQGLEGLEKRYDSILKRPQHTLVQKRDARGRPFYLSQAISPDPDMKSLVLTIDKDIQYRAQQALKAAVEKNKAKRGHCILLDPETGEILAMVVVPLFNPNVFGKYQPHQWRNLAITDCYEPGSTLKAFLAAAALDEECLSPQDIFYCEQGKFEVGNETIHDTKELGWLTFSGIIAFSSNIGAVKIGQKLGYERYSAYLKDFGFGSKTGIDLIGERNGFVRPVEKSREIDQATVYYGQGMDATSLQIAVAMGAIANGGKLMRPYVVKAIVDQSGRIVEETKPRVVRRVISPQTSRKVTQILQEVVTDEGTGSLAAINGYGVAGKTGTAQKVDPNTKAYSKENFVSSFVGFMPTDKPELVILVMVDEPNPVAYGGLVAAPVFQEVGAWALHHLRIPPQIRLVDMRTASDKSGKRISATKPLLKERLEPSGLLPDFRGQSMREVLKRGRALGLGVVLEGTGLAVEQTPRPGSSLEKTKAVMVTFRPPI
jgi:cell division protein FtsI (penicillin-binding protein 3)